MTETNANSVAAENERSLNTLVRSLTLSQGQFSLILVRCNYQQLREQVRQRLKDMSAIAIDELTLPSSVQTLYSTIQTHLQSRQPAALMVFGLESVEHLDTVLISANLVRDEFRKNLPFPLVLWVDDNVLTRFIRLAPDLKGWAVTSIRFNLPPDELIESLRAYADEVFDILLNTGSDRFLPDTVLNLETGSRSRAELEFALQDITNSGLTLDAELQASLDFLRGRDAHATAQMENARQHYESSLAYWANPRSQESGARSQEPGARSQEPGARSQEGQGGQGDSSLSSPPPPSSPSPHPTPHTPYRDRQACLLFYLGLWWRSYAVLQRTVYEPAIRQAKIYFEQCLDIFRQEGRRDLVAKLIPALGETLQKLRQWPELETVATESIALHQDTDPVRLARDYGFLAEVAQSRSDWLTAKRDAETALSIMDRYAATAKPSDPLAVDELTLVEKYHRGWCLLLLARSLAHLGEPEKAIAQLKTAQSISDPKYDPPLYLQILQELRDLYFAKGHYREAFWVKQQQRSLEQQYRFRAFLGAGRLEPQRQILQPDLSQGSAEAIVAQEIIASGRQRDVERLITRIGTPKDKLIVIHGASGVGKSSIINAGLVPALYHRTIEARPIMPLVISIYDDWPHSLERCLTKTLTDFGHPPNTALRQTADGRQQIGQNDASPSSPSPLSPPPPPSQHPTPNTQYLLDEFRQNQLRNLFTVLLCDQFEEFIFTYPDPLQRKPFYDFLRDCLNIPYVKVILGLREDYLHYLLEFDRLADLEVINHDILSKDIRYPLSDFSCEDARAVIQSLTERSQFYLEADLVDVLVEDLAGELGGIRPIELQIVGAQLQEDKIDTLPEYRQLGDHPKETLVQRSLQEVVDDCGPENEAIAQLVLFVLTNEDETRPFRTRVEIMDELQLTGISFTEDQLDLVLEILVGSGLVLKVLESPADRYQLVHDYLVRFIREQQKSGLVAELEAEREKRKLTEEQLRDALRDRERLLVQEQKERHRAETAEIDALGSVSQALLLSHEQLGALVASLKAGLRLQDIDTSPDLQVKTMGRLWQALYRIRECNRFQHHASVYSISLSSDGSLLASAGDDNVIRLWDLSGELLGTFTGHADTVRHVCFSPNGTTLLSGSDDRTLRLWSLTGETLQEFTGHQDAIRSVSFSGDSKLLASASDDNTVKLWNLAGEDLLTFDNHHARVFCVAFSHFSKRIVSGDGDGVIKIWEPSGKELRTMTGHQDAVLSVQWGVGDRLIASGSADNTVRLWTPTGEELQAFWGHRNSVLSVDISPDGTQIVSGSADQSVKLWDLHGKELYTFRGHRDAVREVCFSPDGQAIASGSADTTVKLWRISGEPLRICREHRDWVFSVCFNPAHDPSSPTDSFLASASGDRTIKLWNHHDQELRTLRGHTGWVRCVRFTSDGRMMASGGADHTIKIWNQAGKVLSTFQGHRDAVLSLSFSPDSNLLASSSDDNTIRLWNLAGETLHTFQGHTARVLSVEFSPDGRMVVSGSADGTVKLWNLCGEAHHTFRGHRDAVRSVCFSPNGRLIASASADGTVKLWTLLGEELHTFQGHRDWVLSVCFSPDGQAIASGSADTTIKLWSLSGEELHTFQGHQGWVRSVQFSPDGKTLASGSEDHTVILWSWDLTDLLQRSRHWLSDYLHRNPVGDEGDRNGTISTG
ncbi:MAG TPA: hypothetical protein V6C78_07745 [Crinalium sp.]